MKEFFRIIRLILKGIYYIAGGLSFLIGVLFLTAHNFFDGFILLWIGVYLCCAGDLVCRIKANREKLGKIRHDLLLAAIRAPITAFNLIMLVLVFVFHAKIQSVLLMWILLLIAWSVIPLNMLADKLEKKICS